MVHCDQNAGAMSVCTVPARSYCADQSAAFSNLTVPLIESVKRMLMARGLCCLADYTVWQICQKAASECCRLFLKPSKAVAHACAITETVPWSTPLRQAEGDCPAAAASLGSLHRTTWQAHACSALETMHQPCQGCETQDPWKRNLVQ